MSIGINLKGIDTYKVRDANEHYNEYMIGQMKAKLFLLRQPTN